MFEDGWAPGHLQLCQRISFLAFSILNASSDSSDLEIPRGHIFLDFDGVSILIVSFCLAFPSLKMFYTDFSFEGQDFLARWVFPNSHNSAHKVFYQSVSEQ